MGCKFSPQHILEETHTHMRCTAILFSITKILLSIFVQTFGQAAQIALESTSSKNRQILSPDLGHLNFLNLTSPGHLVVAERDPEATLLWA